MIIGSRQAEGMLAAAFGIEESRLLRFRGRLDHLRRYGCPSGTNTGKGRAAAYGWGQLIELSLALTLLDLGISPENAARTVEVSAKSVSVALSQLLAGPRRVELAVSSAGNWKWPVKKTIFLVGSVYALAGMRSDGESFDPSASIADYRQLVQQFEEATFTEASGFVIDLGTRVAALIALVNTWTGVSLRTVVDGLKRWLDEEIESLAGLDR